MERRERRGIMLCKPLENKNLNKMERIIIQPKLDGVRCRAIKQDKSVVLLSSTEREIILPHIQKEIQSIEGDFELDGELYLHGWEFERIESITSRTVSMNPEYRLLEFHIFDMVLGFSLETRLYQMRRKIFGDYIRDHLREVSSIFADLPNERHLIDIAAKLHQEGGYEGIVVKDADSFYERKRSSSWLKYKPFHSDTYLITGLFEEVDKYKVPKGRLGGLTVRDTDGKVFNVGSGLTKEQRIELWKYQDLLIGKDVRVKYFGLTAYGIPRHPVFVEIL